MHICCRTPLPLKRNLVENVALRIIATPALKLPTDSKTYAASFNIQLLLALYQMTNHGSVVTNWR